MVIIKGYYTSSCVDKKHYSLLFKKSQKKL